MRLLDKRAAGAALLAFSLLGAGSALAQSVFSTMTQQLGQSCPAFISKLLENPDIAGATRARPVSVPTVCSCAQARLAADKRLEQHLNVEPAVVQRRMAGNALRQYFSLRLMEGVFACLAPELDASLNAAPLPE